MESLECHAEESSKSEVGSGGTMFPELEVLFWRQGEEGEGFKPARDTSRLGL